VENAGPKNTGLKIHDWKMQDLTALSKGGALLICALLISAKLSLK